MDDSLYTHCPMGVARSENVVDLPLVIHVDDVAIMAACGEIVDAQAEALADFPLYLGVLMRAAKKRYAARLQLYTGLWWNSVLRTLQLETERLDVYMAFLDELAEMNVWTLNQAHRRLGAFNARV